MKPYSLHFKMRKMASIYERAIGNSPTPQNPSLSLSLSLSLCVFFPHVDCCRQLLHRRLWTHFAALSDDGVVTQKPKHQPHQPMRVHRLHRRRLLDNDNVRSCGGCVCARLLVEETNHVPSPTKTTSTII